MEEQVWFALQTVSFTAGVFLSMAICLSVLLNTASMAQNLGERQINMSRIITAWMSDRLQNVQRVC